MRIHSLNCATLCPRSKWMVNGAGGVLEPGRLVCHCLLLETKQGLALVDTGLGTRDIEHSLRSVGTLWRAVMRPTLDPEETALRQIERMGFDRRDVRHIILTHLDFDHAGGMADFPEARVHVHVREHDDVLYRWKAAKRRRYVPSQWAHKPLWKLYRRGGERWMGFTGVREVKGFHGDVLLVPLFGHSAGHCGVAVHWHGEWVLHCGDAFFHHWEMASERARTPLGIRVYENIYQQDRRRRIENQERLRELVRDRLGDVWVMNSHDPVYVEQANTMRKLPLVAEPAVLM